jgi:hypothetical protein
MEIKRDLYLKKLLNSRNNGMIKRPNGVFNCFCFITDTKVV